MKRIRYKFSHRGNDGRLYWYSETHIPGDSRVERISCDAAWFWRHQPKPLHFGYLPECPDGMPCTHPGCLLAHVATPLTAASIAARARAGRREG